MKIVHADEVEWKRGLQHRGGTFHYRHLLEGKPGTPNNFHLGIGQQDGDFASPRHRHNFDQFRFQIEGTMDFDRNGKMAAGALGYFPEGAAYGPQTSEGRSVTAVLQFGGASGNGYLSPAEVSATTEELKKFGTFEGGIFRRNGDVEGRRNSDAYQAIWEHVHGRRMDYPKPRYRDPIMVDPENYDWLPVADVEGVRQKPLGTFTERECAATLVEIAPGTSYRASGPSVYLFLSGAGAVGGERYRSLTALHLDAGETAEFAAREATQVLRLVLPNLAGLEKHHRSSAEAAE
jgi:hypothetical protein